MPDSNFTAALTLELSIKDATSKQEVVKRSLAGAFSAEVFHHSQITVSASASDELQQFPDIPASGLNLLTIFLAHGDLTVKQDLVSNPARTIKKDTFIVIQDPSDAGKFYFSNIASNAVIVECILAQLST